MVNLAEKHDDADSVQLADAEISRILSALHHAEFKKSETQNARVDQTFKPRSLMEVAEAAQQQDEAAKAAAEAAKQPVEQTETAQDTAADDLEPSMATAHAPEMQPEMPPEMPTVGDAGQAPTLEVSEQPDPEAMKDDAAASTDASTVADSENTTAQAIPTSPFETAQAAYDRGYADGDKAGRTAAENELRVVIQAETEAKFAERVSVFETALMALAKPQSIDIEPLSQSIQAAVIRLAAARTGMAIEELPDIIIKRIDALAAEAGKKAATGQVIMHPDDCAVIAPIIATRPESMVIEADAALQRGDIRIRFDGIEIDDFMESRLAETQLNSKQSDKPEKTHKSPGKEKEINDIPVDDSDENNDLSASEEAPGLLPLTSKSTDDAAVDDSDENNDLSASEEAPGLLPLTSKSTDDAAVDDSDENDDLSASEEAPGLLPLTSKKADE